MGWWWVIFLGPISPSISLISSTISIIHNLIMLSLNIFGSNFFVKMPATWSLLLTNDVLIFFEWFFSEWMTIHFDIFCLWNIRLNAMWRATWLSQSIFIDCWVFILRSTRGYLIHVSSLGVDVMDRYSTLALDQAIIFCFLLFHVTKFSSTNTQKSVIDFQSKFPAQCIEIDFFPYPFFECPYKYLNTRFMTSKYWVRGKNINWLIWLIEKEIWSCYN
jgi:hypothetical protein